MQEIKEPIFATCDKVESFYFDRIKDLKFPNIKKICYLIIKESENHNNFVVPAYFLVENGDLIEMAELLADVKIKRVIIKFDEEEAMKTFCDFWVKTFKEKEAQAYQQQIERDQAIA